ncbi:Methyl-accepting chemotaxis protein II [Gemmata obscuriglobus]|uniref:Methyl-accepting chemotaxis protein n=1 Tax=Gemmata obscuriglobus TaxID=114 RepID=A0A2Z3HA58_9BACT|nr:methyl-accepting chemotaxis protein [Gemmata obscuriglobus]AWM40516.1 methyl-accepting chemotaxis protein [Gemmata obscuriglobus]QEG26237.1 Methyl-accepting chemotaxis protein II [Gemmata obscuriglobus]VTS01000.1 chemotaxis protein : Histidine kinase, HAMP region:chemotaxis sensory transducer OS=Candidatus Methylomirabilis oxyfera GN=DAMO_1725 PE=4 SV=1: 4HB_MCP_1: HAMP: MCPsignal [Gemmata obscuriglobus UQM 2246]
MKWFLDRSVATKLLLGFAAVCAAAVASGAFGSDGLSQSRERMGILYADYTVAGTDLAKSSVNLARYRNGLARATAAKDRHTAERLIEDQRPHRQQITDGLSAYAGTVLRTSRSGRDERADLDKVRAATDAYFAAADRMEGAVRDYWAAGDKDRTRRAGAVAEAVAEGDRKFDAAAAALDELVKTVAEVAKDINEDGNAVVDKVQSALRACTLVATALSIAIGLLAARSIARPLSDCVTVLEAASRGDLSRQAAAGNRDEVGRLAAALNTTIDALRAAKEADRGRAEAETQRLQREAAAERERLEREQAAAAARLEHERAAAAELRHKVQAIQGTIRALAAGDFTASVPDLGTDDMGQMARSLNEAVLNVRTALEGVREVSEQLADASGQLSSASDEISSGAQEQASSLEETASTLQEITSTVRQSADSAQQARQLASGSKEVAEKGGSVVSSAVGAMSEINASSKKIADIITTIDEIAFQTNLLALNAAVEAARAGEQGRGFAVVATEVRNLAQRSATAAKEIKGLIQDSVKKVEAGTELVNKSGDTLAEIVTSVKRVTDIVTEMAAASREQSTGIEQVNKAVSQMDTVTQRNASQTEEMSATAQTLTDQAGQLRDLVGRFKLGSDGHAPAARPAKRAAPKPRPAVAKALKRSGSGGGGGHELDAMGGDGFSDF